jgi:hypothetical protein
MTKKSPLLRTKLPQARARDTFVSHSASLNRRSENVVIEAVVVSKLKLRNVQLQILGADFVEGADHFALNNFHRHFSSGVSR